jgi:hypothetical protein
MTPLVLQVAVTTLICSTSFRWLDNTSYNSDFELVDPTMLNDACDLGIKTRVTSMCLWGEDNPVHLTPEGYRDLALVIREHAQGEMPGDGNSVASSDVSGQKRRAPKSIMTRPPAPPPKRGRGVKLASLTP